MVLLCKWRSIYVGSLSVFGLAIGGYLLYSKLKKPEQNLIDVTPPLVAKINIELKEIFLKYSKNFYHIIYTWSKII